MNRKERRAAESTGLAISQPERPNAVRATVTRSIVGGPTTFTLGQLQFTRAERTFAADCAIAKIRIGSPELHFAQLDPMDETRIVRMVMVRFEPHRFVERAKGNEPFRQQLEAGLASATRRTGHLSAMFQTAAASTKDEPTTALVDAEVELTSYSGGRAAMVFLTASQNEIASVVLSDAKDLWFSPDIEVTMTTHQLADLLASWKTVAEVL